MNVVDAVLHQCRISPASTAIIVPGGQIHIITYAGLERVLNSLTREMLKLGFERGDIVGINVDDKVFHIGLALALNRLGVITISCGDRPLPQEIGAKALIANRAMPAEHGDRIIRADPRWISSGGETATDRRLIQGGDDDECGLFLTTESTGAVKAVALTHNAIIARNANLDFAHGSRFPRCARLHCDMDLSHAAALGYVMYVLMRGGTILLGTGFSADIETAKTLYRVEHMVTTEQDFKRYLNFYKSEKLYQCELDHVVVLGRSLPSEVTAQGREYMTRNIITCYGPIETGPVACVDSQTIADVPGAAGYILPGVKVEIVDTSGQQLPPGVEGTVRVQTGSMAKGYFGNPEQTRVSFRDGFYYPGDRGTLSANGLLTLTGYA